MGKRIQAARRRLEQLDHALDLPLRALGKFTMEVTSNREAVLSGAVTVREYDEGLVRLSVGGMGVAFEGKRVFLRCFAEDSVIVEGEFSCIRFEPERADEKGGGGFADR